MTSSNPSRQRDPVADPIAFAIETWHLLLDLSGEIGAAGFLDDEPHATWENRDEALRLAGRAARTPGGNVDRLLNEAQDAANDLAGRKHDLDIEVGVIFEQLRQGLTAHRASMRVGCLPDADRASVRARLRAELDALSERDTPPDDPPAAV